MIDLTRNVQKPHHHIKLNYGFIKDLGMWKEFISNWNGANFFLSSEWHASDTLNLHTDTSGSLGFGGIFRKIIEFHTKIWLAQYKYSMARARCHSCCMPNLG
jgi:hypothetical protein